MKKSAVHLRRITLSAVFLSISLVLGMAFSFEIPMFGQNGMRIGIAGIFSMLPSILFGPVYGAAVSGLADVMGYLLKPSGPYLLPMTLAAAAGGFIRGALWAALRNKDNRKMRIAVAVFSVCILALGICNAAFLSSDGVDGSYYSRAQTGSTVVHKVDHMHLISKMLITRTENLKDPAGSLATYLTFVTAGLMGAAVFGIILLAADILISKKFLQDTRKGQIMQLLIALVVSGLIVTTLNTVILRETIFTAWKVLPFAVVWIPRAIEEILGNTVKAYFIAALSGIFNKQRSLSALIYQPHSGK